MLLAVVCFSYPQTTQAREDARLVSVVPFFSSFFSLSASVHSLYSFPHRFLISSYLFVRSFIHSLPRSLSYSFVHIVGTVFHCFKRQCDICCKVVADNSIVIALASVWCSFGSFIMLCVFLYIYICIYIYIYIATNSVMTDEFAKKRYGCAAESVRL